MTESHAASEQEWMTKLAEKESASQRMIDQHKVELSEKEQDLTNMQSQLDDVQKLLEALRAAKEGLVTERDVARTALSRMSADNDVLARQNEGQIAALVRDMSKLRSDFDIEREEMQQAAAIAADSYATSQLKWKEELAQKQSQLMKSKSVRRNYRGLFLSHSSTIRLLRSRVTAL